VVKSGPLVLLLAVLISASVRWGLQDVRGSLWPWTPREPKRESPVPARLAYLAPSNDPGDQEPGLRAEEGSPLSVAGQEQTSATKEDLIKLFGAGFSEEFLIEFVRARGRPNSLSASDLVELKNLGLSDRLLGLLLGDPLSPAGAASPEGPLAVWPDPLFQDTTVFAVVPLQTPFFSAGAVIYVPPDTGDFPAGGIADPSGCDLGEAPGDGTAFPEDGGAILPDPTFVTGAPGSCRCPNRFHRPHRPLAPGGGPVGVPTWAGGVATVSGPEAGNPVSLSAGGGPAFLTSTNPPSKVSGARGVTVQTGRPRGGPPGTTGAGSGAGQAPPASAPAAGHPSGASGLAAKGH
jgi:hypothetical protein